MRPARLLFATGGSGGHIYPALAVAREASARGHVALFLGQAGGMEARIIPAEGYPFHGVAAGKWRRGRPDPRQALRAGWGLGEAALRVRQLKPDLVIGFGGFASFPGLAAARLLGIPYALHEGNAFPGRVTRWLAGRAALVMLAQEAARPRLKMARRLEHTGFPVREVRTPKREARARLGLPETGLLTLVMGGSQGARALNAAVPSAFAQLPEKPWVLHSSGEAWHAEVQALAAHPQYQVRPYVDACLAWAAADLAITRAGVSTLAEAAFHGVPALMVPLPSAAEDHQLHNARAAARAGAGWVIEERDLERLARAWQRALEPEARQAAASAARRISPEGAARRITDLAESLLLTARPARGVA